MAWTTADIGDLSDTTAVVTGANGGLGLETARALADHGAHVIMGARDQAKAADAHADITATIPGASLEVVALDLGSLESVADAARTITTSHDRIDILVNNAGVMAIAEGRTSDGFERQLGVNHLGHWALTAQLLTPLLAARAARVVSVTSTAHHMGRAIKPANPHLDGRYSPWKAYGQSKLANFHFALGLQRRFAEAGVSAISLMAHPGLSNTDLQATSVTGSGGGITQKLGHRAATVVGMSAADGALPQLRAATDPAAGGSEFYAPRFGNAGPPVRRPVLRRAGLSRGIARLWEVSTSETGIALDLAAIRAAA